jgi:hypothetical protein
LTSTLTQGFLMVCVLKTLFFLNLEDHSACSRLISHQPAVLFSQNKPATNNQQPASSTLLSKQTSTSHQPPANRTGYGWEPHRPLWALGPGTSLVAYTAAEAAMTWRHAG